ncbi:HAD-IC family P-type ATPase [Apilactobacillus sp. TMW 2.2459]|uniref:HAD-IC family P-type ATPase n=1 Tax=Apilactobacillus xinyiensis TaxID=2841032 RepID=UPI00200F6384|nr:HAD-IC family P-type ATPase [Apilactobacillus xinyiensis]MCL0312557.1 HAD-IC family P-type ATPase [Apilactobacillus xinyiensis]
MNNSKDFKLTLSELKSKYNIKDINSGLDSKQAKDRLEQYGTNELKFKKESKWKLFLRQFNNVIIYVLIFSAILTLLLQHFSDSFIIILVIFINAFIGYYQEANASNALEKIKSILATNSTVYRDGHRIDIPTKDVVVGDVVFLEAGDKVPADMRLIDTDNVRIQESSLTGESDSIAKDTEIIKDDNPALAEQTNMAFAYTSVTSGSASGIVVSTGKNTEIGRISENISQAKDSKTPLMRELDGLGKWVSYVIIFASALLFLLGFFLETYSLSVLSLSVVAMIVGSIPEGLPATTSVVLSRGVSDMAKNKNTIIKSLPAVETLGSVDVIATDKTGTLTKNEMTIKDIILSDHVYQVTGNGYTPKGEITENGNKVQMNDTLKLFLEAGNEANDAQLNQENNKWVLNGEPTDGAFLTAYTKALGTDNNNRYKEIDLLPFDSDFRYIAKLVDDDNGKRKLFIKGSPDKLLALAQKVDKNFDMDKWNQQVADLSEHGKRVIAVGYQDVDASVNEITHDQIKQGIHLLGLAGIIDPPRESVMKALREMNEAGIAVKMITGDNPITAKAIGEQLGLAQNIHAVTGAELDGMNKAEFKKAVLENQVFARTTPQNKYDIIKALQDSGKVTAMTGDGINDAPALKRADIGVAMGNKGTDIAKESADMVLTDDKFGTLAPAIKEGRRIYDNIKKSIQFLLPTSFAEGLIIAFTILMQNDMPLQPTQLLWINMVSAITIQFAFIFEPGEQDLMKQKPRKTNGSLLNKWDGIRICWLSALMAILGIVAFEMLTANGFSDVFASTVVVNVIVFAKIFYLFSIRTKQALFSKTLFSNPQAFMIVGIMILLQLALTYIPFMQGAFYTTGIGFMGWSIAIVAGVIVLALAEVDKFISKKLKK